MRECSAVHVLLAMAASARLHSVYRLALEEQGSVVEVTSILPRGVAITCRCRSAHRAYKRPRPGGAVAARHASPLSPPTMETHGMPKSIYCGRQFCSFVVLVMSIAMVCSCRHAGFFQWKVSPPQKTFRGAAVSLTLVTGHAETVNL